VTRVAELAKTYVDWPMILRCGVGPTPPFRAYVVQRRHNAENVARLRQGAVGLHSHELEVRQGTKFDLICSLLVEHPPHDNEWVVLADDDVRLTRGNLGRFVAIADRCRFDIAQPGHDRRGFINFGITASKPLARARLTSFVEIGPLFAVSPASQSAVLATFRGARMGWGLEAIWYAMGLRLGIVDEIRMRHLAPAGKEYDIDQAVADRDELVRRYGINQGQPHETLSTIHAWQPIGFANVSEGRAASP
jgi:hypothetical protein